jgi:hypothetical protein
MVNPKYTPILKWKAAEMGALHDLTNAQKDNTIPLFEFVRPLEISDKDRRDGMRSPEDKLLRVLSRSIPNDISNNWGDGRLFFADFTLIFPEDLRKEFARNFCKNSDELHLEFTPVINLSADSSDYQNTIVSLARSYASSRLCIRLSGAEIQDIDAANLLLTHVLSANSLELSSVSLIIDLKEETSGNAYDMAFRNIQKIKDVAEYSEVILAGGAFPKDMSPYSQTAEDNHKEREEWKGWLTNAKFSLTRTPIFADYTIRYPIYDEVAMKYSSTATIKYTLPGVWKFYKGGKAKNEHYLANASLLRELQEYRQFGPDFSAGDKFIDEKGLYFPEYNKKVQENPGKKVSGAGNTEQWLRAGINHHIAVVVDQLSNLDD